MISRGSDRTTGDYLGTESEVAAAPAKAPVVFLLPGLIDDDPEFDAVWDPIRKNLDLVKITYLDWTELIKPETDITKVILHLTRQMESRVPAGPLLIAGYSIGGRLGYAAAAALEAGGRSVMRLAILDASANTEQGSVSLAKRFHTRIRNLFKFHLRSAVAALLAKLLTRDPMLPLLARLSRFRHKRLPLGIHQHLHRTLTMQMELRLFRSWWQALTPPTFPLVAPTFVFRSEDYDSAQREDLGWSDYCVNCKVIRVAGDHGSMLHADKNERLLALMTEIMTATEG